MNKTTRVFEENEITKEVLDGIKVDDLIRINDWKKPLRVKGVSDNYFVMVTKQFGNYVYSICEKKVRESTNHNGMEQGYFHCGRDNTIFGYCYEKINCCYDFENQEWINAYLSDFETGSIGISERSGLAIKKIIIKS